MKLNVPEILKVLLVDDWEAVTKNNQVRSITHVGSRKFDRRCGLARHASTEPHRCRNPSRFPRIRPFTNEPRVRGPCKCYQWTLIFCRLRDPTVLLPTVISGLQVYFDRSLGANLLYRFERPQYAEIRKQFVTGPSVKVGTEKEMSAVYGAEHLLRMIGADGNLRSVQTLICTHSEPAPVGFHLQHGPGVGGDRQGLCTRVDGVYGEGERGAVPAGLRQRKPAISKRVAIIDFGFSDDRDTRPCTIFVYPRLPRVYNGAKNTSGLYSKKISSVV